MAIRSDLDLAFALSDRGNAQNEDFACVGRVDGTEPGSPEGMFGVLLDGATGLFKTRLFPEGYRSDAQWLSHVAGGLIARGLRAGEAVEDVLAATAAELRRRVSDAAGMPFERVSPDDIPSCTLSIVQVCDGNVRAWALGDSPVVIVRRAGDPVILQDERLIELDEGLLRLMVERSGREAERIGRTLTVPERRELVMPEQRENRRQRNVPGGYWIFDPAGEGLGHLMRAELPASEVRFASAFSDGFFAADERYGILPLVRDAAALTPGAALAAIDRMRVLEADDADLARFPRLKAGDDASLFQIMVGAVDSPAAAA